MRIQDHRCPSYSICGRTDRDTLSYRFRSGIPVSNEVFLVPFPTMGYDGNPHHHGHPDTKSEWYPTRKEPHQVLKWWLRPCTVSATGFRIDNGKEIPTREAHTPCVRGVCQAVCRSVQLIFQRDRPKPCAVSISAPHARGTYPLVLWLHCSILLRLSAVTSSGAMPVMVSVFVS